MRLGRTRVGRQDLAAADAAPESPNVTNALLPEPPMSAAERLANRLEDDRFALQSLVKRCRVQSNGDLHQLGQQRRRTSSKPVPPAAQRGTRHIEPTRKRAELQASRRAQREHLADGGDFIQPSKEQEIRQQRMT